MFLCLRKLIILLNFTVFISANVKLGINSNDLCKLPLLRGSCNEWIPSWYFDSEGHCSPFVYKGCDGNENRFATKEECELNCDHSNTTRNHHLKNTSMVHTRWNLVVRKRRYVDYEQINKADAISAVCKEPEPSKQCTGGWETFSTQMYYYKYKTNSDGSCETTPSTRNCFDSWTHNVFYSESDCKESCTPASKLSQNNRLPEICKLPKKDRACGLNNKPVQNWYFSISSGCTEFTHKCKGNANRFTSKTECELYCVWSVSPPPSTTRPTTIAEPTTSMTSISTMNTTETMTITMTTTQNVTVAMTTTETMTKAMITSKTPTVDDILTTPQYDQTLLSVEGRGPKTSKKYDDTGSDSDIIIEDKRTRWWEGRKDVIHKVKNVCLERYDPGDCEKEEFRFAYVFELNRCGKFVYEGCGAGNNKFKTKEECDETCWVLLAPKENCVDVPGCNGETQKWRFDSTTGTCVSIKNSCSQYHPNRFDNKKGCEETCRKRAIPPRSIAKLLLNELDVSRASIFEEAQINKNNWPSGIIRYYIDEHDYDEVVKTRVRSVLDYLESVTCLQFKRLNSIKRLNHNWLHFTNPDKQMTCNHRPNFDGSGEITVVLGHDCIQKHELLHTILHGLGLKDEVTHPQRDQYVKVMWDNIQPDNRYLFNLDTQQETLFEYDPRSVMHFKDRAYSMNEQPTIIPLLSGLLIQPSKELSQLDKKKLNFMFAKGSVGDLSKPQCFLGK